MSFIIQEQAAPVLFEIGKEEPTGAGGTIDFYLNDQDFLYFEGNASANFAIDLAFDAATTLDDALNVDDLVTITLAAKNGSTPYYLTNFQIDGGAGAITIEWENGLAPSQGNANSIDYYIFKVLKTSGNQYSVFAETKNTATTVIQTNKELIFAQAASASTIYLSTEESLFYQGTATSGFSVDATFASGIQLNQIMATGDIATCTLKAVAATGATFQGFEIDGGSASVTFFSESFPPATDPGYLNKFDFEIVKVSDATFNVDITRTLLNFPGKTSFAPSVIEVLVIAGGGSGAFALRGGGGGAGGYRVNTSFSVTQNSYTVTVGAGGSANSPGSNSTFGTFESAGGGQGASPGAAGGSGGGSTQGSGAGGAGNTPNVSPSQGNNGGASAADMGGGGGGAGAVGQAGIGGVKGGDGGAGTASSITGSSITRAGGGGGANSGAGGAGGGGGEGVAGTPNTGGGGGRSATGGSGIVIIAYPTSSGVLPNIGAGLTYSISTSSRSGYNVITFTAGSDTISWT